MPTLPCLVSFCQAFPPLYEDTMSLLIQVGQVCASNVATQTRDVDPIIARESKVLDYTIISAQLYKTERLKRGMHN